MGEIQKLREREGSEACKESLLFRDKMKRQNGEKATWSRLWGSGEEGNFRVNTVDMKIYRRTTRKTNREIKMHRWTVKMNRLID